MTCAHAALVESALGVLDRVICVVPKVYPHKSFHGAPLETRLEMLRRTFSVHGERFQASVTEGGLFIDIARELRGRQAEDSPSEFYFICGKDAAERVILWDYGEQDAVERMLEEFRLLVAARRGEFVPPTHLRDRVESLQLDGNFHDISSTEVRRLVWEQSDWEHLVPAPIVDLVRKTYSA